MGLVKTLGKAIVPFALAGSMFLGGCSDSQPPQPQRLEQRISQEVAQPNGQPDKYAVLINGRNENRFRYDISLAYQVLLENGFRPENVYILDETGNEKVIYPADDIASKEAIEVLSEYLAKKIDSQDFLLVHITDHGERVKANDNGSHSSEKKEITSVVLPGEDMNEIELFNYLNKIHPKTAVFTTDVCYGGGLAQKIGSLDNYVAISGSKEDENAYGQVGDSFTSFFYQAFRDKKSDKNYDGRISVEEAYKFATVNHPWSKGGEVTPLLISNINAQEVFLK